MSPLSIDIQLRSLRDKKRPVIRLVGAALAGLCFMLTSLAGWELWSSRASELNAAEVVTANLVRGLAAHAEATLRAADLVLETLVERAESNGPMDQQGLRNHLRHLVVKAPELHGLFIYGEHGEWIATSLEHVVKANNADRAYFKFHQTHPDAGIHVGAPIRSRSTGVWIIPVSRRLQHPDGSFAGVALATIRLDFFERIYAKLNVGQSGTVMFTLDDGTLYYRKPFREDHIGKDISGGPLIQYYRARGPVGTAMLTARIDGVKRLYSYRHLDGFPLIVAAALSADDIFMAWRESALKLGAGLLLFLVMLGIVGRKLLRQLAIRERLEQQLHAMSDGLAQANKALSSMALTDGLTQLANRRAFDLALERECQRAKRNATPVSLIMLDVDWFKAFNDTYGHQAGDKCLQQIAGVLRTQVTRQIDMAARYGGEEFVVLLPETDAHGALVVAERIRESVFGLAIAHQSSCECRVTISAGIATFAPLRMPPMAPAALIEAADTVLYESKQLGRNRVSVCRDAAGLAAGGA